MYLTELEVEQALSRVRAAFPNLTQWEYSNEHDGDYFGFTVCGCFVVTNEEDRMFSRHFYVTCDKFEGQWRGVWTIGRHNYLWSSADVGDAFPAATNSCATLA